MTAAALTLDDMRGLDREDPLAEFRDQFVVLPDGPVAYFDGNSLGRLPVAAVARVREVVETEWGRRLIRGWVDGWSDLPTRIGDRLGSVVLGAAPGQTVVADSTSVNLYKVLNAAVTLRPGRHELVIDEANFPTDRYIVEGVAQARGLEVRWVGPDLAGGVTAAALKRVLGPATAAVVLCHVDFRSGFLADMRALTALIHSTGALAVWDLCHSAGVIPTNLDADGADFAVGCTYKYLNAGPGAPAFLYAAARHHDRLEQPIPGWFGAHDVFAMAARYEPAPGIRRMLSGSPAVLGLVCVDAGLDTVEEAGVERIRAKSIALTEVARSLCEIALDPLGWKVVSPPVPARRGSHITVTGPGAAGVVAAMIELGAIPDLRHPDLIRIGLSPLTTTFVEVWEGIRILGEAIFALT